MQQFLASSETRLRAIFDNAHVGILITDADRVWLDVNQALCNMLGVAREHLVGRKHPELIPAGLRVDYEQAVRSLGASGGWRGEFPLKRPDGSEIFLDLQASLLEEGMIMLIITDITDRHRTEEALRASEAQYKAVIESQTEMLCRFEPHGNILFVNQAYARAQGTTPGELIGKNFWEFVPQEDHQGMRALLEGITPGAPQVLIENRFNTDGGIRWTLWTNIGLRFDKDGTVVEAQSSGIDITDRKLAEQELQKARERLQVALSAGDVATWSWDVPGDRIYGDENLRLFYNVSEADANGGPSAVYMDSFHPGDRERILEVLKNALESTATGYEAEYRLTGSDGVTRWVLGRASIERDAEGKPLRVPGVLLNITERKQAELDLAEARQRLEVALAAGDVGTWIWYLKEDRIYGDRNMALFFNISEADRNGCPVSIYLDAILSEDRPAMEENLGLSLQKENSFSSEYRVRGSDGKVRWVLARGTIERDANGEGTRMLGVLLDITERKRAEQELIRSESRFAAVFNTIDEAYALAEMVLDEDGRPVDYRFLQVNPSFATMTDVPDAEGRTIREIQPNIEQRWIDTYARVALDGEALRFQDGSEAFGKWWDIFAMPVEPRGRFIVVFKDITQSRREEENLRETDRRKDQFLATLAHELRNPLAPLRNGMQVLEMAKDDPVLVEQTRIMMDRQLGHLVRLVDDLMDLSRISRGRIELRRTLLDLVQAVRTAVEAMIPQLKEKEQELVLKLPGKPLLMNGDETRLAQIVGNLVGNANRYTPKQGRVEVALEQVAGTAVLRVIDNGIGMEADQIPKAFEMFTQLDHGGENIRNGGLGIGLNIVGQLVEKHGGSITAHSDGWGRGSTFTVHLPLAMDAVAEVIPSPNGPSAEVAPHKVLVVDDLADVAESMAMLLRRMGHQVRICSSGEEAVHEAAQFLPELVLMDIGMPGMNGHDACRAIREHSWGRNMHIIAVSGWGQESDVERSRRSGFDRHFVKPLSYVDLLGLFSRKA